MNGFRHNVFVFATLITFVFTACHKEESVVVLAIEFTHSVGSIAFVKDNLNYVNAAGNQYEVNELQYFISDVVLHKTDGSEVTVNADNGIHYVDIDIPGTMLWNFDQAIPVGDYAAVSFTFGIKEAKNKTGLYVNPPERDMFWPDVMGGGYHYMKMNGQWKNAAYQLSPFNFHIGLGMMEGGMGGMGFIQNHFRVQVPNSGVILTNDSKYILNLNMDIAGWFITPHLWDWNETGGAIMNNQSLMRLACENGADAFSCTWKKE